MNKYNENNSAFPDRIFIYRDGVSDGAFNMVKDFEVPQIRGAFKDIGENYK